MASINLSGILLNSLGEVDVGGVMTFTHLTTTGETIASTKTDLIVPPDGSYNIDVEYGLIRIDYRTENTERFVATVIVNSDSTATSIPELLSATTPVAKPVIIQMQGLVADAVAAETAAEAAAASIPLFGTIESFSKDLNPTRHLRRMAQTDAPVVCIMGDSISTPVPTISLDEVDSMWGVIQRRMTQDNPDVDFTFENRAIGGSTWTSANPSTNLNATPLTLPDWVGDGGAQPWLDYVEALAPDVLYLAWGMNDAQNFVTVQFRAVVAAIQLWAKVPDIVFVTNMRPNSESATPSIGDPVAQQGRDFVANYVRTWSKYNGYPIIDLNRFQNIKVGGYDPTQSYLERSATTRATVNTPYTVTSINECSNFGWNAEVVSQSATFWNSPLKFSLSPYNPDFPNSASFLELSDDAGFIKIEIADNDDVPGRYISTTSTVVTPATAANYEITVFVKGGYINVKIDDDVIYEGRIRRHGGKHLPKVEFVSGKSESLSVFFYKGTYNPYMKTVTEDEMWGVSGELNSKGGNGENHPSSQGAARVYWPLFKTVDFRQPVVTEGSTDFTGTTERKAGIRKLDPKGILHIGDGAVNDAPSTNANNLVLEDADNVGMSLLSDNTGVARINIGDQDDDNVGGLTYSHSTDTTTLRAGGVDALTATSTRATLADQLRFKADDGIIAVNAANRSIQFTLVNDTTLRVYVRGNDGTARSVDLTLA